MPVAAVLLLTASGAAQVPSSAGATGRVSGVVFDSLIRAPLVGATVLVRGSDRVAVTDAQGRWVLEGVPAGQQTVTFSHPALDSVGLFGLQSSAVVPVNGAATLSLATPSLKTLYARLCHASLAARPDSGIVVGVATGAEDDARLEGAEVVIGWMVVDQKSKKKVAIEWPSVSTVTDARGSYAACGVATGVAVTVRAAGGEFSAGETETLVDPRRFLARHDLVLGRNVSLAAGPDSTDAGVADSTESRSDSTAPAAPRLLPGRATLVGMVVDSMAVPRAGARVLLLGSTPMLTDASGRFRMTQLPAGSHTIEARALGFGLARQGVVLRAGDTTWVEIMLMPATVLREARITAKMPVGSDRAGFELRRRGGGGYFMSGEKLTATPSFTGVFGSVPSLQVSARGGPSETTLRMRNGLGTCVPHVFVDGMRADVQTLLYAIRPSDLVAIEVYPRGFSAPAEFLIDENCGVVVAWTKISRW